MQFKLKTVLAAIVFCCCVAHTTFAQSLLELTVNKTSSIIFPAGISAVDRGSRDILAQKVKGVENVLQVKAGRVKFKETNLTVITIDGRLHHFLVTYADAPKAFTIQVGDSTNPRVTFKDENTSVTLEKSASTVLALKTKRPVNSTARYQMKLALQGIYIQDNTLFYHLRVTNGSNIPFHTDMLRFYIRDKQNVKRTASQEVAQEPIYHTGKVDVFAGKSSEDIVFAIPKCTLPDAKVFIIELMEKNGGRHLQLQVRNRSLIKAKIIAPS
ncbi:conjugative transposon protein TraN [Chryseolinea lacunae]|uniref:Conjugative transposon protein TraN n=1 Tax=Chryseolinea lacunae TaxID=2801331 RepID=A0ABS1L097_9BACT|nr:conjugative transposon protein TraN [Chryseolinea lacunae]MBL0744868.1 conjugative transposon protein TraN [Chryseolinea lacunae]